MKTIKTPCVNMATKHTPGPWFKAWVGEDRDHFLHVSSPTGAICDLPMFQYGDLPPSMVNATREANARLIASAPELLEALVKAIDIMETEPGCGFYRAHIAKFKAAISKAEGK